VRGSHGLFVTGALTLLAALRATLAFADIPDEIQVYDDSLNEPGQFGLEIHTNHSFGGNTTRAFPDEIVSGDATRLTGEFSYGLTTHFEAGMYLDFVAPEYRPVQFAGPKLRLKWIGQAAEEGALFYGLNFELGYLKRTADYAHPSGEVRPILGVRTNNWLAIVNPILDFNLGSEAATHTPVFAPALKVARRIADGVLLGPELYREMGPVNHFYSGHAQATQLYLALDVQRGWLPFNFGIGRGWNGADTWIVKAIFELPLPGPR
jgi:hypothetical protein